LLSDPFGVEYVGLRPITPKAFYPIAQGKRSAALGYDHPNILPRRGFIIAR
jgi:hypothetical protein